MTIFWRIVIVYLVIGFIVWLATGSISRGLFWIFSIFEESDHSDYDGDDDFD